MLKIQVFDNFFDNFNNMEKDFKSIKLYPLEEFNKKNNTNDTWPGFRSDALDKSNPFLFNLFIKEFKQKFNFKRSFNLSLYMHLRLAEHTEQDFIHIDLCNLGTIVYLQTNLESGTNFYNDDSDEVNMKIQMVKNRCILFDSKIRHKSQLNFGKNIEDGRLTLNGFIHYLNG